MDDIRSLRDDNGDGRRMRAPRPWHHGVPVATELDPPTSAQTARQERRATWLAVAGLTGGVMLLAMASLAADAAPGQYIVVAAPFSPAAATIDLVRVTGGALISPGGLSNVVIVHSESPDFAAVARAAGAWAVLPAPRALGCVSPSTEILADPPGRTTLTTGTAG